ncbi:MAG TPA: apolipoprotein N-acyltransferase [Rhodocyclaceae bacterium]|nr:apolipoprotein N-acyltransferase [Rhodocyclaceae bacterium]
MRNLRTAALAAAGLSGAISVLGWAPFGWWLLPLLTYAMLFRLLGTTRTAWQAGALGLAFGFGLHLAGHGWVLAALHRQSGLALVPAALATTAFVCYLALFTALPCALWRTMVKGGASRLSSGSVFAALTTIAEWSRSLFFNGFTSLSLGYSLADTPLSGYAPVVGVYGLSCLGYGLSAALASKRGGLRSSVLMVAAMVAGGLVLGGIAWVEPDGPALRYRLIQTNVEQHRKFDPRYAGRQMQRLLGLIEQGPADLIVTPETAFTVALNDLPGDTLSELQRFSRASRSHLLLGIATTSANAEDHNSVIQIAPDARRIARYDKVRLMPFGEYAPAGFAWFSAALDIPLKDLSPGLPGQRPLILGSARIGTLICHEDLIGRDLRRWLPEASLLINPSNLAWFEGSLAIGQRLQIVQMRALESGRPILRVANTGVTALIDHRGRVLERLPEMQQASLSGQVQPMRGMTPYARLGDLPIVAASAAYALLYWLMRRIRALFRAPRSRPERDVRVIPAAFVRARGRLAPPALSARPPARRRVARRATPGWRWASTVWPRPDHRARPNYRCRQRRVAPYRCTAWPGWPGRCRCRG